MPTLTFTDREVKVLINLLRNGLRETYHDDGDPERRRKRLVDGILPMDMKEEIGDILGKLEYTEKWKYRVEALELKLDRLRELEQRIIGKK
ncbi:MAG: hypothetical protein L6M37_04480 [Candidatus Methylarchaceae archaeon HK02M1]|nr:hypothetical protein [Candidatus Methylarchaceae archaeon HK01M]MCP8312190.1 hypothetical protein [Candidatus Methylarchaceae archaeon HK02M1]